MPRSSSKKASKKASAPKKAAGYWVTYETDMGPVPRGTPCMCLPTGLKPTTTNAFEIDCVLFWANHHVDKGKMDGNVWMLGQWSKCTVLDGPPEAWPGGEKAMKSTEKLLDHIFEKGEHVTMLMGLGMMLDAGSPATAVIDGTGEGAWCIPA
jgi:hypothetical protein